MAGERSLFLSGSMTVAVDPLIDDPLDEGRYVGKTQGKEDLGSLYIREPLTDVLNHINASAAHYNELIAQGGWIHYSFLVIASLQIK